MKEVFGLATVIVILILFDRWYFKNMADRIDDHLLNSPNRSSMTKRLRSMGAPADYDPVEYLTSPRNRILSRLPIWIMIAMLGVGILIELWKWMNS